MILTPTRARPVPCPPRDPAARLARLLRRHAMTVDDLLDAGLSPSEIAAGVRALTRRGRRVYLGGIPVGGDA